ncbi:MAG: methylthioribulose 1-phosphate dehydratase [Lysobacterales bacterium]
MNAKLAQLLLETINALARGGLCRATGGNFSARIDAETFLITRSGADKARLTEQDFLVCDLRGAARNTSMVPSAESPIHAAVYGAGKKVGAVLHTHSVALTALSLSTRGELHFSGYEMQKSITGQNSHEQTLRLPVLENSQDMQFLHDEVTRLWPSLGKGFGFVLRGHGLYAWGENLFEARRHIEGFEYLAECELAKRLLAVAKPGTTPGAR